MAILLVHLTVYSRYVQRGTTGNSVRRVMPFGADQTAVGRGTTRYGKVCLKLVDVRRCTAGVRQGCTAGFARLGRQELVTHGLTVDG